VRRETEIVGAVADWQASWDGLGGLA